MSQTSYAVNQGAASAGLLADNGLRDVMSFNNPAVVIPFGVAVAKSTGDDEIKLPTLTGDLLQGVSIASMSQEQSSAGVVQYPVKEAVPVLRKGRIWVTVEEAVVPTDSVFVRFAAGAGTQLGAFRKDADVVSTVATAVAWTKAKYLTSAAGGGLALLEVTV